MVIMKKTLLDSQCQMLLSYVHEKYDAALQCAESLLADNASDSLAVFVKALCLYRRSRRLLAEELMQELETQGAALDAFDFMYPLLVRQEKDGWLVRHETRLNLFLRYYNSDSFIVSYPKSGRTWLRLMIGVYLLGVARPEAIELYDLTSKNTGWPTIDVTHDDYPMWKPVDSLVVDKSAYAGKRVLFLARDPRDVIVSYYFQYTKRGDKVHANEPSFDGTMSEFIKHDIGGLPSIICFMNIWARQRHVPDSFQLARYEDLKAKPVQELSKVLNFLGWENADTARVKRAVRNCEFSRMKKMERKNKLKNARLKPPNDGDPEGFKVRKGVVGGYREYLSDEDVLWINDYINQNLDDYFCCYKEEM